MERLEQMGPREYLHNVEAQKILKEQVKVVIVLS